MNKIPMGEVSRDERSHEPGIQKLESERENELINQIRSEISNYEMRQYVKDREQKVQLNDLISYCDEFGMDNDSLRFTEPEYFIENVHIPSRNRARIRELMMHMDRKYLTEE